jgi:hypothetical protein
VTYAAIPAAFSGPLTINVLTDGDGFGAAPHSDSDPVTIAQAVPFMPCVMTCPANITVNLDPGACNAIVSYPLPTLTGTCMTGSLVNGFQQVFAPSAINYYQYDAGIFTNPPSPFTNAYALTFNSPTNTTLTLKSADFGFSPGPNLYYFNGVEWKNTTGATANISFNWTYTTNDGAFWDQFVYLIGTNNNNFANNNFGNQLANWTKISNPNGANNQNGASAIAVPANGRIAFAAFTQDAFGGPATIVMSNFVASAILQSVPVQTSGQPPGTVFDIGTTTNCFSVTANNAQGVPVTTTCCFNVVVNEYPTPTSTLACNDNVQVSVNDDCEAFVSTDMILEGGPYHCYDDYLVTIQNYGSGYGGVTIDNGAIGQTLYVTILDPETGNSCWGTISVEDKIPPFIDCNDFSVMCGQEIPENPSPAFDGAVWSIADTVTADLGFSLSCSFGFCNDGLTNHYFQVYSAPSLASTATRARVWLGDGSTGCSPTGNEIVTVTLYTLNDGSFPYDVSSGNRTLLGASAPTALDPAYAGEKFSFISRLVLQFLLTLKS